MLFLQGPRVSVIHKRVTRVSDGVGGFTESWGTIETFNAILNPVSAKEKIEYGKDTVTRMYKLYIEVSGRTITEQDRITYDSNDYKIIGIENPFEQNLFYKIILEWIQ